MLSLCTRMPPFGLLCTYLECMPTLNSWPHFLPSYGMDVGDSVANQERDSLGPTIGLRLRFCTIGGAKRQSLEIAFQSEWGQAGKKMMN